MSITKEPAKKNPSSQPSAKVDQRATHAKDQHAKPEQNKFAQQNKNPSSPQQKEKSSWK